MSLDQLLNQCESELERHLLRTLYPALSNPFQKELVAQYLIDELPKVTLPDFALPRQQIAIYCDGHYWHRDEDSFETDRWQSRELQLRGWIVLRFAEREILRDVNSVVEAIQRAIEEVNSKREGLRKDVSDVSEPVENSKVGIQHLLHPEDTFLNRPIDKRKSAFLRRRYRAMKNKRKK